MMLHRTTFSGYYMEMYQELCIKLPNYVNKNKSININIVI